MKLAFATLALSLSFSLLAGDAVPQAALVRDLGGQFQVGREQGQIIVSVILNQPLVQAKGKEISAFSLTERGEVLPHIFLNGRELVPFAVALFDEESGKLAIGDSDLAGTIYNVLKNQKSNPSKTIKENVDGLELPQKVVVGQSATCASGFDVRPFRAITGCLIQL